jgi:hypothetical protein
MTYRVLAALVAFVSLAIPASAQQACGPWEEMLLYAANEYGEYPAYLATSNKGYVIVVTVNPETGTFTVFAQPNESTACAVDSGEAWGEAPEAVIDNIRKKVGTGA